MSSKRWLIMLACIAAAVFAAVAAFNALVDPFSVFGDRLFDWPSYGMTNNPKTAKLAYVDSVKGEFDAFIIGPSGASGFSCAALERYTGLSWYNMFHYGANMEYTVKLAEYLIESHRPKQLLLCLPPVSAADYSPPIGDITSRQPLSPLWRLPFLFSNPKFAWQKIADSKDRSYLQGGNDWFDAATGQYDKTRRDAEAIGPLDAYLAKYPEFLDPGYWPQPLNDMGRAAAAVGEIADMCKGSGIGLTIVIPPMLEAEIPFFNAAEITEFYSLAASNAGVDGFWSFMLTPVSADPRYFYDATHFRDCVGEMMAARIFGDESAYMPEGFGVWVTADNVASAIGGPLEGGEATSGKPYTIHLPVLMYHHIAPEAGNPQTVSPARFREQMEALRDAGFAAISPEDALAYVHGGVELPERPILITFDDGYMSCYEYAFPVLRELGFHATIFAVGVTFGANVYKDSGLPVTPHFGRDEAVEMSRSGLISIQSHSYDMHNAEGYDDPVRDGALRMPGEAESAYVGAFKADDAMMKALLSDFGDVFAFSYPYGRADEFSAVLLRELGYKMTFVTAEGMNALVKGLPQSLLELKRFSIGDGVSGDDLVRLATGNQDLQG